MTTIAYNHKDKQIAVDSRSTSGDSIIMDDDCDKSIVENGVIFIFAGYPSDNRLLMDAYFGKDIKRVPDCSAFVIDDGVAYKTGVDENITHWKQQLTNNDSIGSGRMFALAAMDFGKTAAEAVEYAKTRDCYTGGEVHVFNVESLRG